MGPRTHRAVRRRAPTPGFGGDIPHTEQTRGYRHPNGGERGADLYSRGVRPGGGGGGGHVCAHIYKQRDTYGGRSLRWRAHGAMEGCPETQTAPGHHYIYGGARDSRERGDTLTGVKWNINVAEGGERNMGYHYGGIRGTGEGGGHALTKETDRRGRPSLRKPQETQRGERDTLRSIHPLWNAGREGMEGRRPRGALYREGGRMGEWGPIPVTWSAFGGRRGRRGPWR